MPNVLCHAKDLINSFALSQVSPAYARQGASSEQIYTLFGHCLTIFHILQMFDRYVNKKLFVESLSKGEFYICGHPLMVRQAHHEWMVRSASS